MVFLKIFLYDEAAGMWNDKLLLQVSINLVFLLLT